MDITKTMNSMYDTPDFTERPHMLLADDDETLCQVLARALTASGYAIQTAYDAASALRVSLSVPPDYAVIDLRLPDMSGLKLLERLKAQNSRTQIVVLTGYGSIATAIEAIKLGAVHYLTKPVTAAQILAAFSRQEPNADEQPAANPLSVDRVEWEHIQRVLSGHEGNISATARALNMHRRTLQRKLGKHAPRM
jgi:two-component system, response regulator RegA